MCSFVWLGREANHSTAALLLCELDGIEAELVTQLEALKTVLQNNGASDISDATFQGSGPGGRRTTLNYGGAQAAASRAT